MRIAILGAGNVGGALGKGWARAGHVIAYGVPQPSTKHQAAAEAAGHAKVTGVADAVRGADAIVLAVPFGAAAAALRECGNLAGRIVIDATNPLRRGAGGIELSVGFAESGAEQIAATATGAAVFKTLNQVGFEVMADATGYAAPPVMFVAGDDIAQKPVVLKLVADLGFNAIDVGPLAQARLLEPFAMLWIHLALNRGMARDNAFAYLERIVAGAP